MLVHESEEPAADTILFVDDLDALVARFDVDYRHEFLELLTALARGTGTVGPALVVAAHRLSGPLAGLAGMFGSRLLLRQTSREEHVLCGGDPRGFDPDLPPGAGTWRGAVVQVARAGETDGSESPLDAAAPAPVRVVLGDHPVLAIVAGRPRVHLDWLREAGAHVIELGGAAIPSPQELQVTPVSAPTVLLGDPEAWLADWAMLAAARRDWPIVLIDATPCGSSRPAARSRRSRRRSAGCRGSAGSPPTAVRAARCSSCPRRRAIPKNFHSETADFVKSMFRYGPFRRRMIPAASAVCQYRHTAQSPPPSDSPEGASA